MQGKFRGFMSYGYKGVLFISITTPFCLGLIAPPKARASQNSTLRHQPAFGPTLREIDAELHRRGIDPHKLSGQHRARLSAKLPLKTLTIPQIARLALPSVVRLTVLNAQGIPSVQGSGFVVGKNMIVTNWHVVKGAHAVTANFQNGRSETVCGVVNCDASHDIVILYMDTTGIRPLPLAVGTSAQVGDTVIAVGSPEGLSGSVSTGIISALRYHGGAKTIQTTAPISHGSSGGALLDVYGRVLGMTSFFVVDGQNLNFAYASYYVKQLMLKRRAGFATWQRIELFEREIANVQNSPHVVSSSSVDSSVEGIYTEKPLTNLKGVAIVMEDVSLDAKRDGLNADQIKADVELRLRMAGITQFDTISSVGNDSTAALDINIQTVKNGASVYGYAVSLDLDETVRLLRSTPCRAFATVWTTGKLGTERTETMAARLRQAVDDEADQFVTEYLAQNPK